MSTVFYTRAAKCFSKTPGRRPPHVTGRRAKIVSFVVAVFTLTHRYNAVRGHRTGSNNSGEDDYPRSKTNKNRTEYIHYLKQIVFLRQKRKDISVRIKIKYAKRVAAETETEETAEYPQAKENYKMKQTMFKAKSKKGGEEKTIKSTSRTQKDSTQGEYPYFRLARSAGGV